MAFKTNSHKTESFLRNLPQHVFTKFLCHSFIMLALCVTSSEESFAQSKEEEDGARASTPSVHQQNHPDYTLPKGALTRLGTLPSGHDSISKIVFSPDNKQMVVWSPEGFLWIWRNREERRTSLIRIPGVHLLALGYLSRDHPLAITESANKEIRLWDLYDDKGLPERLDARLNPAPKTVGPAEKRYDCFAIAPDGHTIAACETTKSGSGIFLWSYSRGNQLQQLPTQRNWSGPKEGVRTLLFSSDGRVLACIGGDGSVRLWEVNSGKIMREFRDNTRKRNGIPYCWDLSSDCQTVAEGRDDGTVHVIDIRSGKDKTCIRAHASAVCAVAFSADGKELLTGGADKQVKVWDPSTGNEIYECIEQRDAPIRAVAFSPDGLSLAWADDSGELRLRTGRSTVEGHTSEACCHLFPEIKALSYSPNGRLLAVAGAGELVQLWDSHSHQLRQLGAASRNSHAMAFSGDGRVLATSSEDNVIRLWDPITGSEIRSLCGHTETVIALAFSPKRKTLASSSHDGTTRLWDLDNDYKSTPLPASQGCVTGLAFSPDGTFLAVAGSFLLGEDFGSSVMLVDAAGKEKLRLSVSRLIGPFWMCNSAFSPDGRRVVSVGDAIHVWDTRSGCRPARLPIEAPDPSYGGWRRKIESCVVSADGRSLFTAEEIGAVQYEFVSRRPRRLLDGHAGGVSALALSPDGKTLATGGRDGTTLIWNISVPKDEESKGSSNLTEIERERYWKDLSEVDAKRAFDAIVNLANDRDIVPFLQTRLKSFTAEEMTRAIRLVDQLESDTFDEREQATAQLAKSAAELEPLLLKGLTREGKLELQRRIRSILDELEATPFSAQHLRLARALELLEAIPEGRGRQLLEYLASGAEGAWITLEAKRALERLSKRITTAP
jgi:WD40 repeat protein